MNLLFIAILFSVKVVTFSRWECNAITESKYRDGRIEYSAHYKGKEYVLTWDQYCDLMAGKDISLKVEEPTNNKENEKDNNKDNRNTSGDN